MASLKKVRELLEKLDLLIKLEHFEGGCIITYPKNVVNIYTIEDYGFGYLDENNKAFRFELSDFATRIGIMCHLVTKCKKLLYNPSCIVYYINDETVESISDILPGGDELKEGFLCTLIHEGLTNDFSRIHSQRAEEYGVLKDFNTLLEILEEK